MRETFAERDQICGAFNIVLRLGKEVCGSEGWIGAFIRDDANFARPGEHVNVHSAPKLLFCKIYIDITRPDDFVHTRNSPRGRLSSFVGLRVFNLTEFPCFPSKCP